MQAAEGQGFSHLIVAVIFCFWPPSVGNLDEYDQVILDLDPYLWLISTYIDI